METIKFKTTIKCSGCVNKATPFLSEALGEDNWEVDTDNPLKLLSVIGDHDKKVVVNAVEMAGFKAEEI